MKSKRIIVISFLLLVFVSKTSLAIDPSIHVVSLRCEYREDPEGIDVLIPRLSWIMETALRADDQTAYRILIASTPDLLNKDKGDLWDSGKINSSENHLEYAGSVLKSRKHCYWKVKIWNSKNKASEWSKTGYWSMGLLSRNEWKGLWITDPVLADTANFPLTPINCYRSNTTLNQSEKKWVVLDLIKEQQMDAVDLIPARPKEQNMDFRSLMYPLRFKIEVADHKDFSDGKVVVDCSEADILNPREAKNLFIFPTVKARYIKLLVNKLSKWDSNRYGLALGGFKAYYDKHLISASAKVSCADAVENSKWSIKYLSQMDNEVTLAPDPAMLAVNIKELADIPMGKKVSRVPTLRREFTIDNPIKRATLYVTARGFYEFHINGLKVGAQYLSPGVSDYNNRIAYQTYDVTKMIKIGDNAMGALLGYGWYAGHMNLSNNRNLYGFYPLLLAQLEVELTNGRRMTIATDKDWKTTLRGPVIWSDLLDGEAYDYRQELTGWDLANYKGIKWTNAYTQKQDSTQLVWQRSQPVKISTEIKPVAIKQVGTNVYVVDFGQEIAGWCRLKINSKPGMHIILRHAEVVKSTGDIDLSNLWDTAQQDDYILNSNGTKILNPHFTYHGFRYVQISGLTGPPDSNILVAVSLHSAAPMAGHFLCSNPLFNKMMQSSLWTEQNMMYDMPNGCAARSERLGWLGDIRPCVQTVIFNMDGASFLEKYMQDIRDAQTTDGRYTDIAPHAHLDNTNICVGSPGWADAGISMPWQLYENYGDKRLLREHYESAKRWVNFILIHNPDLLWKNNRGQDWGDWLSAGPETPKVIGSTAFFAHDADQLSLMAGVLGNKMDEIKYKKLFNDIKAAFVKHFVDGSGCIRELPGDKDVQGSYAVALHFNLLNDTLRAKAVNQLVRLIKANDGHPTTGFWSSIEMLLSLSDDGKEPVAAAMVNLTTKPSWGYMMTISTTFWESFDADTKNLSLNHWPHSAVGEWLWRYVAGLNPDTENPAYKSFTIHPYPSKEVSSCTAEYESVRGPIIIKWQLSAARFVMDVNIPAGSTAKIYIPAVSLQQVTESGIMAVRAKGLKFIKQADDTILFEAKSGIYHFNSKL